MSVTIAYDLWSELRTFMSTPDRPDAAAALVSVLIDNDYDADEIRSAFKGDPDIKQALQSYIDDNEQDPEDEDNNEYDGYDEDEY